MAKFIPLYSVFVASHPRELDYFEVNNSEIDIVHNSSTQQVPPTIKMMLFVDTGLFPTHDPTRTLGVMEQERWINLPVELAHKPFEEQIKSLKAIITTHYAKHHRGLPLWGDIQRYCLYKTLANGRVTKTWFGIDGAILAI